MFFLQLKRLEAYGFKSFADKITIEFDKGVTAVVGPNGSGKSNITDAIRWVLGEQNVRNLRGTKSEDIIFAGSVSRRQLGVADVTLTFINEGDLPIDYDEVVVERRLYRSGESEFYINKSRCRLKDIYALFADTGLGHDGLSVIGQNKIDDILNSRPEERRLFFEETAGITKFRDRKRESVRKLDDTEKNLTRVTDIMQEIETQLEPLAEQAERTRKYNAWNEEYKECRITELYRKQERSSEAERKGEEKIAAARDEVAAGEAELGKIESNKELISNKVVILEKDMESKAEEREKLHDKIEETKSEIRVLTERQEQGDANWKRITKEIDALDDDALSTESEKKTLSEMETTQKKRVDDMATRIAAEREKSKRLEDDIRSQKERVKELAKQKEQAEKDALTKQSAMELIDQRIESDTKSRKEGKETAESLRAELEDDRKELKELTERVTLLAKENETLTNAKQEIKERIKKLTLDMRERQQTLRMNQQYIGQAEAKLSVLTRMQEAYDGFGRAARMVLLSKERWRHHVCGAVAELINVPQKYLTAIMVALGASQQSIVTDDAVTAKEAIAHLKRTKAGRATFLPLDTIAQRAHPNEKINKTGGVIGYADEVVQTDEKYKRVAAFLLARTLIVDTIDHALVIAREHGQRMRIVTLSGELINLGGSLTGGSLQSHEAGFMSRSSEIETLRETLRQKKAEKDEAERLYNEATAEMSASETRERETVEKSENVRVALAEARVRRDKLASDTESKETRLDAIMTLQKEQEESFAKLEASRVTMARELLNLRTKLSQISKDAIAAGDALDDIEQDASDFSKYINKLEVEKVSLEHEALRSRERILLKEKEIARINATKAQKRDELQKIKAGIALGSEQIKKLEAENEESEKIFASIDAEYNEMYAHKLELASQSKDNDKELQSCRRKLGATQERLHQLEIEQSRLHFDTEKYIAELLDDYQLSVEDAARQALDMTDKAIREKMTSLEADITALGTVNLNAIEEYDNLKSRHDLMTNQVNDLNDARGNLMRIISQMDDTMTKQFRAAFVDIKKYFNEIFIKLFGGGKAELYLTDEKNVLEAGVEIVVQLPEKKQQNLSVLSGGERALTVIALMFAFLKVRPAPFSVLDEIDAPLDEANIVRFGRFLREFSNETQFVIVTHRKGTMEAADMMYGVTLEDAGVSKIISVKLDDI